ncbi:GNAT family N-acetyltransferase [Streptomyces sp. NPDC059262]|uniref:GNAT family N-acetyltransferase n=1 Tax=Streptomyces sp. NPDC059262 TaxID=3346797 RepID=UPI0036B951CD
MAKGGIDYQVKEGVGTLWQLAVHPALQSCGIGTSLSKPRNFGSRTAVCGRLSSVLGVEENTPPRARALYERLGYVIS